MAETKLFLASGSETRALLLQAAGVAFEVIGSSVDEESSKQSLIAEGNGPNEIAMALAELKARSGSVRFPEAIVIGADQTLECEGKLYSKPRSLAEAQGVLRLLRGRDHELHTAVVLARDGNRIWAHSETAYLRMRNFSDVFLDNYIAEGGLSLCDSAGAYQVEKLGIQLFARITGDHSAILGLPLLPLLAQLRELEYLPV